MVFTDKSDRIYSNGMEEEMPILRLIFVLLASLFATVSVAEEKVHIVKHDEVLIRIAQKHGVTPRLVVLANESYLRERYDKICGRLSKSFRERTENAGRLKGGLYFCNDGQRRPFANTLVPGMRLVIPKSAAPATIKRTVSAIKGDKVALVIDDTGSMGNKRKELALFYTAELSQQRKIGSIILFAGGEPRKIEPYGVRNLENVLKTHGDYENTWWALQMAAKERPDAIVLLTDERGRDWPENWNDVRSLPPVVAHCLPLESGVFDCREALQKLVASIPGSQYIEGLKGLATGR